VIRKIKSSYLSTLVGVVFTVSVFALSQNALAFAIIPVMDISYSTGSGTGDQSPSLGLSPLFFKGGGLLFENTVVNGVRLEWGAIYMVRGFVNNSVSSRFDFYSMQFPLTVKYYVNRAFFIGLGGYYAHGMGNVYMNPTSGGDTQYSTYGDLGLSADDFGLLVSMGTKLNLVPRIALFMDVRYLYGLQNISNIPGVGIRLADYQALVGLRFGGEKGD